VTDEEERGNRRGAGPGLVATLLGGGVLVLLGFGLGLVVGAARQEPGLVFRNLAGETQEVPAPPASPEGAPAPALAQGSPAPAQGSPASPAPVAAPPPAPAAPSGPPPAARAAAPPPPPPLGTPTDGRAAAPPPTARLAPAPPAAVSSPPPPGAASRISIQVGAFAESAPAERLAERLRRKGLPVSVTPGVGARDQRWRVRVGPIATRAEADRLASRLKTEDRLPTWVIEEGR